MGDPSGLGGSWRYDSTDPAWHYGSDPGTPHSVGTFDAQGNMTSPGSPGAPSAIQRRADDYRNRGVTAGQRPAHQADYSDYSYGMGHGQGALGLMQSAAQGNAPSQAEILGGRMINDSLAASHSMAASARGGPMAQASAMQAAQSRGAQMRQAGVQNIAAMRAAELANARGQYMQGSMAYGGMGLGKSAQELQNEQFQRGLNQEGEMGWEKMAYGVERDRLDDMYRRVNMVEGLADSYQRRALGKRAADRDDLAVVGGVVGGMIPGSSSGHARRGSGDDE